MLMRDLINTDAELRLVVQRDDQGGFIAWPCGGAWDERDVDDLPIGRHATNPLLALSGLLLQPAPAVTP